MSSALILAPPPPATSNEPGGALSVVAIEREHGRCRATVDRLTEQRELDKRELSEARQRQRELNERIRFLDQRVQQTNQSIFALLPRLEQLARLRERVAARGAEMAAKLGQQAAAACGAISATAAPSEPSPVGEASLAAALAEAGGTPADDEASAAPAPGPAVEHSEKRRHRRIPLEVEVGLTSDANFYVGFSNDISSGGLFVVSYEQQHQVGERFCLSFRLPGRVQPVFALVEVAWRREFRAGGEMQDGAPGMGLHFVGLAADDREAIDQFIAQREPLFYPDNDDPS